jgi:serine/threonine protein kinase
MAEAIADLHGFKDGVIVHGDIQLCQYLINIDGQLKLNDFNRAEVMLWDTKNQGYCRFRNGNVYGNYRSPEEDEDEPLNEQIDVYSLGKHQE